MRLTEITQYLWINQAVGTFAKLGIPDAFNGRPTSVDELARATGCDGSALIRLLRALTGCGIVVELSPDRFDLGALGHLLRSDHPKSLRDLAIIQIDSWMWRVFEQMPQTVRGGGAAIRPVFGVDHYWTYLQNQPVARRVFDAGMTAASRAFQIPTVLSYDYSGVRRITDIGGGLGQILTAILRANLHLEGRLLDLPNTVAGARPLLAEYGVADRCTAVAGDMFQAVPAGSDVYLLSFVLMDWDDDHVLRLLRNVATVLPVDGRVLVVDCFQDLSSDMLGGDGHPFHLGRTIDLFQMCMGSARIRSRAEFENLFAHAGLRVHSLTAPQAPVSLIELVHAS